MSHFRRNKIQDGVDEDLLATVSLGDTGYNLNVSVDQIDTSTNAVKSVTYAESKVHEGVHYFSRGYATLGNGASYDLLIVTPDTTKWARITFGGSGETGEIAAQLFEDTVTSSDGTRDNERNRNRNYPDDNTTFVYTAPTVTTDGNSLGTNVFGSGKSLGGSYRDVEAIVLKQNTKYLFRITNNTVSNNTINWHFDWYEHADKT